MEQVKVDLPIEASADGKRNAYAFHCAILNQQAQYAVCLHKMKQCDELPRGCSNQDCARSIGRGFCDAPKMRGEELKAGKAIYFVERSKIGAFVEAAKSLVRKLPGMDLGAAPAPKEKSESERLQDAMGGSYADAISSTMASPAAPAPAPKVAKPNQAVQMLPGETPLAAARRLMNL